MTVGSDSPPPGLADEGTRRRKDSPPPGLADKSDSPMQGLAAAGTRRRREFNGLAVAGTCQRGVSPSPELTDERRSSGRPNHHSDSQMQGLADIGTRRRKDSPTQGLVATRTR